MAAGREPHRAVRRLRFYVRTAAVRPRQPRGLVERHPGQPAETARADTHSAERSCTDDYCGARQPRPARELTLRHSLQIEVPPSLGSGSYRSWPASTHPITYAWKCLGHLLASGDPYLGPNDCGGGEMSRV